MWLVGLIEGEGSFTFVNGEPRVTLEMTDHDVVARAAKIINRSFTARPPRGRYKVVYITSIRGAAAVDLMRRMLPRMGTRRQARIGEIVAAWFARIHMHRNDLLDRLRTLCATLPTDRDVTPTAIASALQVHPNSVRALVHKRAIPARRDPLGMYHINPHEVLKAA